MTERAFNREGSIQPIRPEEVIGAKLKSIPDSVIETFNTLIVQNGTSGAAVIKQGDVIALLKEKGLDPREIYNKGWLDVEDIYRKAGWDVTYDNPGYNETYPATFTFRPSKKSH